MQWDKYVLCTYPSLTMFRRGPTPSHVLPTAVSQVWWRELDTIPHTNFALQSSKLIRSPQTIVCILIILCLHKLPENDDCNRSYGERSSTGKAFWGIHAFRHSQSCQSSSTMYLVRVKMTEAHSVLTGLDWMQLLHRSACFWHEKNRCIQKSLQSHNVPDTAHAVYHPHQNNNFH